MRRSYSCGGARRALQTATVSQFGGSHPRGRARIEPGREAEGEERLREDVLPVVRQVPDIVAAYWLEPANGEGLSVVLFQDEESAHAAVATIPNAPRPDFAAIDGAEVRRVIAHL